MITEQIRVVQHYSASVLNKVGEEARVPIARRKPLRILTCSAPGTYCVQGHVPSFRLMGACAATSGLAGYVLARNGLIVPPVWVASTIPPSADARFMADGGRTVRPIGVGFLGGRT